MIILAMLILLNGCSGPKSDTLAESVEKGNYYWSEGPARVMTLASEKEYLEERKLAVHWESEYILTNDAVWKLIAAVNEASERKQYYLYYSIREEKWGILDAGKSWCLRPACQALPSTAWWRTLTEGIMSITSL